MTLDKALDDAIDLFCSVEEEPDGFELTLTQWGQVATLLKVLKAERENAKRIQYKKPKTLDMLENENDELRSLVKMLFGMWIKCDSYEPDCLECPANENRECGQMDMIAKMKALGIEVEWS